MILTDRLIAQTNTGQQFDFMIQDGEYEKVHDTLTGLFEVSKQGYVYSLSARPVIWIKFLTLGLCLGLKGTAYKCAELIRDFKFASEEISEADHILHLSDIAWRAVCGIGKKSLFDHVETFSLAEIDYFHADRADAMNMQRSQRLKKQDYYALCMQPLFHQNQLQTVYDRMEYLSSEKHNLQNFKEARENLQTGNFFSRLMSRATIYGSSYQNFDDEKIERTLKALNKSLKKIEYYECNPKMKLEAQKCTKYAIESTLSQNHSLFKEHCVRSEEARCCGSRLWKVEQICGCVYKIDCCAARCWAIDCLCCLCCVFPADMSCCCFC